MLTDDELRAIAARAWGIVRASTTPELGVVAVHALQARIEGALREQATAAAERERVLREALVEYADDSNWARHPGRDDDARLYLVVGDGYDRARAALEATS